MQVQPPHLLASTAGEPAALGIRRTNRQLAGESRHHLSTYPLGPTRAISAASRPGMQTRFSNTALHQCSSNFTSGKCSPKYYKILWKQRLQRLAIETTVTSACWSSASGGLSTARRIGIMMTLSKSIFLHTMFMVGSTLFSQVQPQYQPYRPYQAYPQYQRDPQYQQYQPYPSRQPSETPPSWSYDPYTSGLSPCIQCGGN
jgi:hypothetical protein